MTLPTILQYVLILIAGLSILVIIHELGHFIPARLFGMRVDKFYLFFDWPFKLFSIKRGGTEYGIGALPLGGYVKIAGIIDESLDKDHLAQPVQPWEYRAKPVWQRMVVMVGGVTMNVLLAIAIFTGISYVRPQEKIPLGSMPQGIMVYPNSIGSALGFRTGDKLLAYQGKPLQYLPPASELQSILMEQDAYFTVERAGRQQQINIPNNYLNTLTKEHKLEPRLFEANPPAYLIPAPGSPAATAGVQKGDLLTAIDGNPIAAFGDIRPLLQGKNNQTVQLSLLRQGNALQLPVVVDTAGRLGVASDPSHITVEVERYSLLGALVPGTKMAFTALTDQVKGFRKIFAGQVDASKSLAGPIKIGKVLGETTRESGWIGFFYILGLLSMALAFMNLLPIPALDGGHLMFLVYEAVVRREPSLKVRMVAQQAGMVLLLCLMAFVFFNDVFR